MAFNQNDAAQRAQSGASRDEMIQYLYDSGADIIDSIKWVRSFYKVSLGDAKDSVASHSAWRQIAENGDKLHQEFIDALKEEAKHNPSITIREYERQP